MACWLPWRRRLRRDIGSGDGQVSVSATEHAASGIRRAPRSGDDVTRSSLSGVSSQALAQSRVDFLRRMYSVHDSRQCGKLDSKQVAALLRRVYEPEWLIKDIVAGMEEEGFYARKTFDQLLVLINSRKRDVRGDLEAAFRLLDTNGDGFLDREELRFVLSNLGERMTAEEVDKVFAKLDRNDDHVICLQEFISFVSRYNTLLEG